MSSNDPNAIFELSFEGDDLKSKDLLSQSDPMLLLYDVTYPAAGVSEIGRTEIIKNCKSPKFSTKISLQFFFERIQKLKIVVIDFDGGNNYDSKTPLSKLKYDLIGEVEFDASTLIWGSKGSKSFDLQSKSKKKSGRITVSARNLNRNETLEIQFSGSKLDKKDFFGKADPYLTINRVSASGSKVPVVKTKHLKNTLDPVWPVMKVALGHLVDFNSGDHMNAPILIECYDWNRTSKDDYIGSVTTTLNELLNKKEKFDLINPSKAKSGKMGNAGYISVLKANISSLLSFTDYLNSGVQISLSVAIDFTASNGNPVDPSSLHHINPNGSWNPYMSAIHSVCSVVGPYDSDQNISVYGFGAVIGNMRQVLHDFHVNLDPSNPQVRGIEGVMGAYSNCIRQVTLSGPTYFAPIIKKHLESVKQSHKGLEYHILLIITDGIIVDMQKTKDAIAEASALPISIVIVGVGKADFTDMRELDNDKMVMTDSNGVLVPRDIVQFVEMAKFGPEDYAAFAAAVLHEIPSQLVDYMHRNNVKLE